MSVFLVTGGAGFIGSHLVERLRAEGAAVRVLDNLSTGKRANLPRDVELIVGDVRDPVTVREAMAGVSGCFHLAAIASVQASTEDWHGAHATNLSGAIAVFDAACREGPIPVVYASSAAVYGDNTQCPLRETAATRPMTAYGADKLGCEQHARAAAGVHGLASVGLRFFNVYGPRQDPASPYSGVISIFAERLANGRGVTINGDGLQTRDFVYVGDVCAALWSAMRHCEDGADVVNVCTGHEVSVLELAETLSRLLGARGRIDHGPARPGDIRRSLGSPARLRRRLKTIAATPLERGLSNTLAWMKAARRSEDVAAVAS